MKGQLVCACSPHIAQQSEHILQICRLILISQQSMTLSKVYGLLRPGKAREGGQRRERWTERVKGTEVGQRATTLKSEPTLNNSAPSLYGDRDTLTKQIRWDLALHRVTSNLIKSSLISHLRISPGDKTFANI